MPSQAKTPWGTNRPIARGSPERRLSAHVRPQLKRFSKSRLPAGGACAVLVTVRSELLCGSARYSRASGKMAGAGMATLGSWVPRRRWGREAVFLGFYRGLSALLARKSERTPRWVPGQCPKGGRSTRSFELGVLSSAFLAPYLKMLFPRSQYSSFTRFQRFW